MKTKDLTQQLILARAEDRADVVKVAREARAAAIELGEKLLELQETATKLGLNEAMFFAGLGADCMIQAGNHLLGTIDAVKRGEGA
jgi:hypothetical protein